MCVDALGDRKTPFHFIIVLPTGGEILCTHLLVGYTYVVALSFSGWWIYITCEYLTVVGRKSSGAKYNAVPTTPVTPSLAVSIDVCATSILLCWGVGEGGE